MSWKLYKIPKVLHMYWGCNRGMSFLRYTSIISFSKYNPNWKLILHIPKHPCKINPTWSGDEQKGNRSDNDYFNLLYESKISFMEHDFEDYGISNDIHEVFKNDFLRWYLLHKMGGVWSDTDIIYVNSIESLIENNDFKKEVDTFLCKYKTGYHAIGFLMSSKSNSFFGDLFYSSLKLFNSNEYQAIGSKLLNSIYDVDPNIDKFYRNNNFSFINPDSVYSIDCNYNNLMKFFEPEINYLEKEGVIGYHWYGGAMICQSYEALINKDNYKSYDVILKKMIDKVYE
jgi:hypothetical protein